MNSTGTLAPKDLWDIAVRVKWVMLATVLVCLGCAYVAYRVSPKVYKSATTILVESQKIPERYVSGVVAGTIQERLSMIQQLVLSRTMLQKVLEELNLYQKEIAVEGLETVVDKVRKNIEIKTVGRTTIDAFTISFEHEQPLVAMKVAAKLASQYIEENLKVREQLVEGASEFLTQELQKAKEELDEKEIKISEFKAQFVGELPGELQTNLRTLDRMQGELASSEEMLQRLQDRISQLEQTIQEHRSGAKTTQPKNRTADPYDLPLRDLERQLDHLRAEYTDSYPDIVMLKERIKRLKEKAAAAGTIGEDGEEVADPYLAEMRKQQAEARRDIKTIREQQAKLRGVIKEYEGRVERTPKREQELLFLVRDYDNLKANYRSLVDKNLSARIAGNLEKRQKGEQFRIIDPANLPTKPEKPDLFRFLTMGMVAGLALGYGYGFASEQLRPVFRRADEVEGLLHLPVIAEIPAMRFAYNKPSHFLLARQSAPALLFQGRGERGEPDVKKPELGANGKNRRGRWTRFLGKNDAHARHGRAWYKRPGARADRDFPRQFALISKWSPTSVVAEQFRVAVTKVVLMFADRPCPVIGITSSVKGEGKSAAAANLAYTLARDLAKRTLLIDCDFKSPTLNEYFELPKEPGLVEMLSNNKTFGECLVPIPGVPLWVLPGGRTEARMVELSQAPQLATLIESLRSQYDYIILDAPPILPLADMNVLARMGDGLLMVIRAGLTPRRVVENAIHRLNTTGQLALILNDIDAAVMPYYMRYEYRGQSAAGMQR